MEIRPSYKEILSLKKDDLDIISIYTTIHLPLENLLNLFKRYTKGSSYCFLLDSGKGPKEIAKYSFMGKDPYLIFKGKKDWIEIVEEGKVKSYKGNIVKELEKIIESRKVKEVEGLPKFVAGGVGYLSYDLASQFEELPNLSLDDLNLPEIYFIFTKEVIVYDHYEKKLFIIINLDRERFSYNTYKKAKERIESIFEEIILKKEDKDKEKEDISSSPKIDFRSNFTKDEFKRIVERAKNYIKEGDIFQVNLSQRFEEKIYGDPFEIYEVLRSINPSPFAAYLSFKELKLISSSPERLLNVYKRKIQTRPIAGTRPRGRDREEDSYLEEELILSPKERAEHIMLVDLERNDLGRICEYGSVSVNELMILEKYSHVIHIVSNVVGRLRRGVRLYDILRATFPGGTITGTPKIRAMEIIEELEPVKRGPYTGSIGCIGFNGYIDLNIVIRTIIVKDNTAYFQVGAGIVADSDPEREYFETLHKAEALMKTLSKVSKTYAPCLV